VIGHPFRGGVHAAGAVQDLERSRAAAGEGVGADAGAAGWARPKAVGPSWKMAMSAWMTVPRSIFGAGTPSTRA